MGFLGKLAQITIDVILLPVDVVKDIATLGGVITDNDETYTGGKVRKIAKKGEEIYDALDEKANDD